MVCRDQCRLEHHVPQGTATSSDGPFPAKGSAVERDRGQSSECSSLFAGDGADLGHFGDQHCAGTSATTGSVPLIRNAVRPGIR